MLAVFGLGNTAVNLLAEDLDRFVGNEVATVKRYIPPLDPGKALATYITPCSWFVTSPEHINTMIVKKLRLKLLITVILLLNIKKIDGLYSFGLILVLIIKPFI